MRKLIRLWFTFEQPVGRRTYLVHGLGLMAAKYLIDAAIVGAASGVWWTPLDYVYAGASFERSKLSGAPTWLSVSLALWTLPFMWIGLTMSMRRALDAGLTPWIALLFFVPLVNYAFMVVMCVVPSASHPKALEHPHRDDRRLPSALLAIGVGTGLALLIVATVVFKFRSYGATLFFGAPFDVGAITAYLFNRRYAASWGETNRVVSLTFVATAAALLAFAFEGVFCIVLSLPLAIAVGFMGAVVGRWIALARTGRPRDALVAAMILPLSTPLVDDATPPALYEVRSAIEIDAPPERVWQYVVSFPALDDPTELIFRSGIAYPIGARIIGTGVGAVRYCEFSTGAFVEPITHWEPGRRLSFDVVENPPALREWSPYQIAPPHLDGYFAARRGEFRLVSLAGGRTRLEGSTWYELDIAPEFYWAPMANALVNRIHQRVLRHIKTTTERASRESP